MAQRDPAQDDTTRILIADGDRDSRLAMSWCLLSEGYRIDPVSDGFSAAAALEQTCLPTIAIIDLGLQGFGGRRLIDHIHSSPRLRGIHIVATGFVEPFAPLPPGVSFLKKPCDGELLLRTIRTLGREDLRSFFPSRREHVMSHPGSPGAAGSPGGTRAAALSGAHPASHVHAPSHPAHASSPHSSSHGASHASFHGSSRTGSHAVQPSPDREQDR